MSEFKRIGRLALGATLLASSLLPVEEAYSDDGDNLQQNVEDYRYDVARWDKNRLGISGPPELQAKIAKATDSIEEVAEIDFVEGGDDVVIEFSDNPPHSMFYANHELYAKSEDLSTTLYSRIKVYRANFNTLSEEEQETFLLHELVHASGLYHSEKEGVLMSEGVGALALMQDDIDGLQSIFGPPRKEGWSYMVWNLKNGKPDESTFRTIYEEKENGWNRWSSDSPEYVNSINTLQEGHAYWVEK